eukprot:CAMPEP_0172446538 /NCGR_PEP_ID=MMETSP1065-20121228/6120_1 /TAXON_ID=265537 /ORGANISM="Amphiprora paludosa, Strain CCMP125" /LENGTH=282 /DNA_ID=CAMNT_0013197683 /DNA_START=181 /DNA_END=1029 /DNA_ORIENTATION=-
MEEYARSGPRGCCCFQCIRTQEVGIVEDLGQFKRLLSPGLTVIAWPCSSVVGTLSLRIQQLDVYCETKTKDNVFVQVAVAVQYRVLTESAYEAFYRLTDPRGQIQSYVFDVIRSTIPKLELDESFSSKEDIASDVKQSLTEVMREYGYEILNSLVTDIAPDSKVKASMNEINASRRLKEAASHKAEADKTKQVKAAEAEAEARYLSGLGVARQRKAIISGLQSSVSEFSQKVPNTKPKDVMDILLLSQYFDTLSTVGANNLFLEHDPSTVAKLQSAVGASFS